MRIGIDGLDVDMTLGNNGILLTVYDNAGAYKGKLRIGRATVEWCKGRTRIGNGEKVSWNDLIGWFEEN